MSNGAMFASYARAEKSDEGMALKIRTRAEDMPDGKDNLENHTYKHGRETKNKSGDGYFI